MTDTKIAVIGIVVKSKVVKSKKECSSKVNDILSVYAHIIVDRMGIPYKDTGINKGVRFTD